MSDFSIQQGTPLYNKLTKHISTNPTSFHTPGHKNNQESPINQLGTHFLDYDLTEIEGLDSLFEADGVIAEAEQLATDYFGCKKTLFSAGGCTLAMQAMIMLATNNPTGKRRMLASRNIHRSAVNTCALLDVDVDWLYPSVNNNGFLGIVNPADVEAALSKNKNNQFSAVYLTSPNYYGVMEDVKAVADICHSYGVPLVVDNAHGTHLKSFEKLHPLDLGADITSCSAHKTWPVFTGGAFLNINNEKFVDGAKEAMSMFGSTSPSYPIMASLDVAREWMSQNGKLMFSRIASLVRHAKIALHEAGYRLPGGNCDPTRIAINTANMSMNAKEIEQLLIRNNIYPEFVTNDNLVFIVTTFNSRPEVEKLVEVLTSVKPNWRKQQADNSDEDAGFSFPHPERKMSIRDAMLGKTEYVSVENVVGHVAASTFCPCPPGVPVVIPGEVITKEIAARLIKEKVEKFKIVIMK